MGQHIDSAAPRNARRIAQICGLVGGAAWVATYFLDADSALAKVLLWGGGVLLTVALLAIGMMLVKGDVLALRVFVALALPTLVWGVFALVRDSVSNEELVDAVFGAFVGLLSVMLLVRPSTAHRATL
jgi:glucose dehydrogenase